MRSFLFIYIHCLYFSTPVTKKIIINFEVLTFGWHPLLSTLNSENGADFSPTKSPIGAGNYYHATYEDIYEVKLEKTFALRL